MCNKQLEYYNCLYIFLLLTACKAVVLYYCITQGSSFVTQVILFGLE